jgi:hypothetical protein
MKWHALFMMSLERGEVCVHQLTTVHGRHVDPVDMFQSATCLDSVGLIAFCVVTHQPSSTIVLITTNQRSCDPLDDSCLILTETTFGRIPLNDCRFPQLVIGTHPIRWKCDGARTRTNTAGNK